jgi:hypothetical protein
MADSTKLYRLRDGAKYLVRNPAGVLRPLEQGGTRAFTDQVAHALRDKFVPVTGPPLAVDQENQTLDTPPDPSAVEGGEGEAVVGDQGTDDQPGPDAVPPGDPDLHESPVNPTEYTVDELKAYIEDDDEPWSPEDLEALAAAEAAEGNRAGVLKAVFKRITHLAVDDA